VSGDLHSPTNAGPTPEPTPTVSPSDATTQRPAGTAAPSASFDGPSSAVSSAAERPEVLVGAAFAGGLITAMLLKRLGR
jgi:hypothetical protein